MAWTSSPSSTCSATAGRWWTSTRWPPAAQAVVPAAQHVDDGAGVEVVEDLAEHGQVVRRGRRPVADVGDVDGDVRQRRAPGRRLGRRPEGSGRWP